MPCVMRVILHNLSEHLGGLNQHVFKAFVGDPNCKNAIGHDW